MKNQKKPLSRSALTKYKPEDQAANIQAVMGLDLTSAYNASLQLDSTNPVVVAKVRGKTPKIADVDNLPTTPKKKVVKNTPAKTIAKKKNKKTK